MKSRLFNSFDEASVFAKTLAQNKIKQSLKRHESSWLVEFEEHADIKSIHTDNDNVKRIIFEKDQEIIKLKQQAYHDQEELLSRIKILEEAEVHLHQKLYFEPQEDVVSQLRNTINDLRKNIAEKEKENEIIMKELESSTMYAEILELDLIHKDSYQWNEIALNDISKENRSILKKYERAIMLKKLNIVSDNKFNEFTKISGLWIALYNYEKMQNKKPMYTNEKPHIEVERCGSCGMAIVNGYCKCSN